MRAALTGLLLMAVPAEAASRGTLIAMAVALIDVTSEHCRKEVEVDGEVQTRLLRDFHEYDIGGLASVISGPLNSFYEEFLHEARNDRHNFCATAPAQARRTGYPVLLAVGNN